MPKICVPRIIRGERSHIKEIEGCDNGPTHVFGPGLGGCAEGVAGLQDKIKVAPHDTMLDLEVLIDVL